MFPKVVHIYVTQDDIDDGERNRCQTCPVALAAKRALQGVVTAFIDHVFVGGGRFQVVGARGDTIAKYTYATSVEVAIHHFDMTGEMDPFDFVAEIYPSVLAAS